MFTSRAEHRLLLREDNADLRLTPTGARRWVSSMRSAGALFEQKRRLTGSPAGAVAAVPARGRSTSAPAGEAAARRSMTRRGAQLAKYAGYIERQEDGGRAPAAQRGDRLCRRTWTMRSAAAGLSHEVRQQLPQSAPGHHRPGGAPARGDAGGGVDPARPSEEAQSRRPRGSHDADSSRAWRGWDEQRLAGLRRA